MGLWSFVPALGCRFEGLFCCTSEHEVSLGPRNNEKEPEFSENPVGATMPLAHHLLNPSSFRLSGSLLGSKLGHVQKGSYLPSLNQCHVPTPPSEASYIEAIP